MKKIVVNYGGIVLFYLVIVLGIIFLNTNTTYMGSNINTDIAYANNQ